MSYLGKSSGELDPVCPGEQWFFYWKTSAALWESRIVQFPKEEVIFLPIYWGFHADAPMSWDFGRIQPERDLKRLIQLLNQHGRRFCWILPLTPAPFLPNGGIPVWAARTLSVTSDGVHLAAFDSENKLHKIFSYFEPKVFQAFSSFLQNFAQFLSENKVKAPLWGGDFYYSQDTNLHSYIGDCSIAFEQGFSRYLKQANPQGIDISKPNEEEKLKSAFTKEVAQLFCSAAQDVLAPFWQNTQPIVVLGGSPKDTIERSLASGKSQLNYFKELMFSFLNGKWISSCLLNSSEKKELMPKVLEEHFGNIEIDHQYHYQLYSGELSEEFRPFSLVEIFDNENSSHIKNNGLLTFLNQNFRWMYNVLPKLNFTVESIEASQDRIKVFHAENLDRVGFGQMLKLFMMGQRVILDNSNMSPDLDKRLQIFLIENNIKNQNVNFMTHITLCELGDGRLIILNGSGLKSHEEKNKFWEHLFKYFHLNQPIIISDEEIFSLWRIRATSPFELNFLDVRRVNLYNPTSYRKHVTIQTQKQFAFMKMIDPVKASARSTSEGVEVELLPHGKIALDFGHYEER